MVGPFDIWILFKVRFFYVCMLPNSFVLKTKQEVKQTIHR